MDIVFINFIIYYFRPKEFLGIKFNIYITIFWLIISYFTKFYNVFRYTHILRILSLLGAQFFIFILAFLGTALAKVMFNELVAISSPVFSISITYLLPIVAIGWGVLDGEVFTWFQWMGCAFILLGVYLVTDKKRLKKTREKNLLKKRIF